MRKTKAFLHPPQLQLIHILPAAAANQTLQGGRPETKSYVPDQTALAAVVPSNTAQCYTLNLLRENWTLTVELRAQACLLVLLSAGALALALPATKKSIKPRSGKELEPLRIGANQMLPMSELFCWIRKGVFVLPV